MFVPRFKKMLKTPKPLTFDDVIGYLNEVDMGYPEDTYVAYNKKLELLRRLSDTYSHIKPKSNIIDIDSYIKQLKYYHSEGASMDLSVFRSEIFMLQASYDMSMSKESPFDVARKLIEKDDKVLLDKTLPIFYVINTFYPELENEYHIIEKYFLKNYTWKQKNKYCGKTSIRHFLNTLEKRTMNENDDMKWVLENVRISTKTAFRFLKVYEGGDLGFTSLDNSTFFDTEEEARLWETPYVKASLRNVDVLWYIILNSKGENMNKYTVSWVSENDSNTHGSFDSYDEAFESIRKWWNHNGYSPAYIRIIGDIEESGKVKIDYGLHRSFYTIVKEEKEEEKMTNRYGGFTYPAQGVTIGVTEKEYQNIEILRKAKLNSIEEVNNLSYVMPEYMVALIELFKDIKYNQMRRNNIIDYIFGDSNVDIFISEGRK